MSLSPNVYAVAEKKDKAHDAIKKLQADMKDDLEKAQDVFEARVAKSLSDARVSDGRTIKSDEAMKVEYKSEFSLDKIAEVINKSLLAVAEATDPLTPAPALAPDALRAYTGVVSAVAEAAKSSSQVASSLSYSMTHLGPGMYAFLYATSNSITDEKLFGTEAISATAIFYRIVESIDDVKNAAAFDDAIANYTLIKTWQALRVDFARQLGSHEIDLAQWVEMDGTAKLQISEAKEALAKAGRPEHQPVLMTSSPTAAINMLNINSIDTVLSDLRSDAPKTLEMLQSRGEDASDAVKVLQDFLAHES